MLPGKTFILIFQDCDVFVQLVAPCTEYSDREKQ